MCNAHAGKKALIQNLNLKMSREETTWQMDNVKTDHREIDYEYVNCIKPTLKRGT
jgi:hypothetical protein